MGKAEYRDMVKNIQDKPVKKVLVVAYSFPPAGGGRVRRVTKFVKFLPGFGWEPVVLTVKNPLVRDYDYALLKEEMGRKGMVVRTPSWEPSFLIRYFNAEGPSSTKGKRRFHFFKDLALKTAKKLKWYIFFPDSRNGWVPFCVFNGWRIIRKEKIDLIFVTAEPFSSLISGVILKKITGLPLVIDFRDEWVGFSEHYFPDKPAIVRSMEKATEAFAVRNADKVISVTKPIIDNFIRRYKQEKKDKFLCITNGFDPEDFKGLAVDAPRNDRFTITYAGSLYKLRSPEYFLEALKDIAGRDRDFAVKAKAVFIGDNDRYVKALFDSYKELSGMIEVTGFLQHKDVVRRMLESDLLLYIADQTPASDRVLPAKLFEYMATNKPVIALADNGPAKEVIEYTSCGKVVSPYNIAAITVAIEYFYERFSKGAGPFQGQGNGKVAEFSRRSLTEKLAGTFELIVRQRQV